MSSLGLACSTAAPQSSETLGNTTATASNTDGTGETAGQSTPGSSATDSPDTSLDPTGGTGTTDASTTALSATTGEPTTTVETSTAAPTTTEAMSTTGETTVATTSETTDPGDTSTTSGTGTEGTTGGMGGGPCEVDADCKLHDDCCSCYGIPNDQNDPICKAECEETQCQQIGIDEARCVLGQCTTEKVDCSSEVACDSLPPDCPPGTLPGIEGACWSGACVPVISCDKVPDCKLCPDTQMCVEFQAFINDHTCLPLPTECGGKVNCECAGEACVEPFGLCGAGAGDVDLGCACPAC